uniref:Uncharacterized protein n=1 Tax=Megaselia scalaris TaxID=36166 RepID=T1GBU9_MEGSC
MEGTNESTPSYNNCGASKFVHKHSETTHAFKLRCFCLQYFLGENKLPRMQPFRTILKSLLIILYKLILEKQTVLKDMKRMTIRTKLPILDP